MSTISWNRLPILPLQCILDRLSLEDALSATSTCRDWRNAIYFYEGHRDTLELRTNNIRRSMFLAHLFRKGVKRLLIQINNDGDDIKAHMQLVLPILFDSVYLYEIFFFGPGYYDMKEHTPILTLNSPVIDNLINVHVQRLQSVGFLGCTTSPEMDDCYEHKPLRTKGISFVNMMIEQNSILTKCTIRTISFSTLRHLCMDYDSVDSDVLESITNLPLLSYLTLNLVNRKGVKFKTLEWNNLDIYYPSQLQLSLNIIGVPAELFDEIIENVLVPNLPLVAIRVLFCKTLHIVLLKHLCQTYKNTLRELHWADSPIHTGDVGVFTYGTSNNLEYSDTCNINPFILICWQCTHLEALTIHGYWIWQYDLLGMARLRHASLRRLRVSAASGRRRAAPAPRAPAPRARADAIPPVAARDRAGAVDAEFVEHMNEFLQFRWQPTDKWSSLHPALTSKATNADRANYVRTETMQNLGVT